MAVDLTKPLAWTKAKPQERKMLADLQGNILKGHGRDYTTNLFLHFDAAEKTGYAITTKEVKYIWEGQVGGQKIYRRKCDFDIEICIDVHEAIEKTHTFIFFTGDGDFAPLYQKLIGLHKQVIVVYFPGHLGREVWDIKKGLFKAQLKNLMRI